MSSNVNIGHKATTGRRGPDTALLKAVIDAGVDRLDAIDTAGTGTVAVLTGRVGGLEDSEVRHLEHAVAFGDFTAEAVTQTIAFAEFSETNPAYIVSVWLERVTDFSGGAVDAFTLEVGQDTGPDPNAYVVAVNAFTGAGAGNVGFPAAERGVDQVAATYQPLLPATKKVTVTGRATTANVDALTAGAAIVHVLYRVLG